MLSLLKYAVEMTSGGMMYIPNLLKSCRGSQKFLERMHTQTDRQTDRQKDLLLLLTKKNGSLKNSPTDDKHELPRKNLTYINAAYSFV
jgi:hypothetical protein